MSTLDKSYAARHPLADAMFFQVWPMRAEPTGWVYAAVAVYADGRWDTVLASKDADKAKQEAQRCSALHDKPVLAVTGAQAALGGGY